MLSYPVFQKSVLGKVLVGAFLLTTPGWAMRSGDDDLDPRSQRAPDSTLGKRGASPSADSTPEKNPKRKYGLLEDLANKSVEGNEEATRQLRAYADRGNSAAMYTLGELELSGAAAGFDPADTIEDSYLYKAAQAGHPEAMAQLAEYHLKLYDHPMMSGLFDLQETLKWTKKTLESGEYDSREKALKNLKAFVQGNWDDMIMPTDGLILDLTPEEIEMRLTPEQVEELKQDIRDRHFPLTKAAGKAAPGG